MKRIVFVFTAIILFAAITLVPVSAGEDNTSAAEVKPEQDTNNFVEVNKARRRTLKNFPDALKKGMTGLAVRTLNHELLVRGYLEEEQNGIFTDETEQALKRFQKDNGLYPDGIAGDDTVWIMFLKDL